MPALSSINFIRQSDVGGVLGGGDVKALEQRRLDIKASLELLRRPNRRVAPAHQAASPELKELVVFSAVTSRSLICLMALLRAALGEST